MDRAYTDRAALIPEMVKAGERGADRWCLLLMRNLPRPHRAVELRRYVVSLSPGLLVDPRVSEIGDFSASHPYV